MKLKRILHIGDLHFKKNQRHSEFRELTEKLCQTIIATEIDLIYIGGDIIDSKAKLSPELIDITTWFLYKVSSLCPLVIIPGNHDVDLKQKGSLDSLTPLIANVHSEHPIYYLKDSGIYNIYDIDWAVWSCLDELNPFEISKPTGSKHIIGCFHGAIIGASTDSNWDQLNATVEIEDFKDCNTVFLNDIHKRQFFRNKEIAYSGSWLQVAINEAEEKGGIIWEYDETDSKYKPEVFNLENRYGTKTYNIANLSEFDISIVKPAYPEQAIRLLYIGTEEEFSPTLFTEIKKKLKAIYPNTVILNKIFKASKRSVEVKLDTKDITDFFFEYFKTKQGCDVDTIKVLKDLDDGYGKKINKTNTIGNEYYIDDIEISNFLCFGKENIVNFTDLQGIIGILAPNATGKSSLLQALVFCLFNETQKKSSSLLSLINDQNPDEDAYVQVRLIINGVFWRIRRTIIPSEKGKVKLEVYETVDDAEVPRHVESRPQTDTTVLRKLIGEKDTFLTTILYDIKNNSGEFVNNTNADRLDLFLSFMGVTSYEQKAEICSEDLKKKATTFDSRKQEINRLEDSATLITRKAAKELIAGDLEKQIETFEGETTGLKRQIKTIEGKVSKLNIIGITESYEELIENKGTFELQIDQRKKILAESKEILKELIKTWNSDERLKGIIDIWEPDYSKYDKEQQRVFELIAERKTLKTQLDSEICVSCGQVRKKIDRSQIEADIEKKSNEIDTLNKTVDDWKQFLKDTTTLKKKITDLDSTISQSSNKIELLSNKLITTDQQIKIFNENKTKIDKKTEFETKIEELQGELEKKEKNSYTLQGQLVALNKEVKTIADNIKVYDDKIVELTTIETEMKFLSLYKKGMHRTGIPAMILETYISTINEEIGTYIDDLFDFRIKFELNENNLDVFFIYDELTSTKKAKRDVIQASGMEGTIINLAVRAALTKINSLPKPSMLMLDEIFTTLDEVHLNKMKELLNKLKKQYYNIVIISHLDEIKDLPEHFVQLRKENGITNIVSEND